jgi:DNA-binding winged helix-turn-helix (wHTH) protein
VRELLNFRAKPECDMEPLRHKSVVRFGTYEVCFQSGELRKAGLRIRVQQQPMKLLEILLERPGEVVTREELRNRVWPNESFGDFDQALNIAIGKLRNALGDSAENPRCIETLPKRGYRFIADVSVVDADVHPKQPESAARDLPWTESGRPLPAPGRLLPLKAGYGRRVASSLPWRSS